MMKQGVKNGVKRHIERGVFGELISAFLLLRFCIFYPDGTLLAE